MPFKNKAQMKACYAQNNPKWDCKKWSKETKTKEVVEDVNEENLTVIQEITEEEVVKEAKELKEAMKRLKTKKTGKPLPENIEKLVSFMEETGGS
jgi:DNA-binding IscR family transcriptional regulator